MTRTPTFPTALVALGVVLLVAPALFPIQPVLYHDTRPGIAADRADLEREGYEVIAYENLSERGKQLYVRTLETGGGYAVPLGEGAPEFRYPSESELSEIRDYRERETRQKVVIERPADDAHLPPPDERVRYAERRCEDEERRDRRGGEEQRKPTDGEERQSGTTATPTASVEECRERIARYDVMQTRTQQPPLTATDPLLRLLSAATGVVALGTGGYLRSKP